MNKHPIYFDNNATTKTDERVVESMLPFFNSNYANPSSHHTFGQSAKKVVEDSRTQIASILGANSNELIFTSGATEAINLAINGISNSYQHKGKHIITAATEHSAVLDVCANLENKGYEIDYLPVSNDGLIDTQKLEQKIRKDTLLVSIMYVNNETGVIQPINTISEICHKRGVLFFTDATQAIGKIPINIGDLHIDLLSFSGHKIYGPKGIGGLFVKKEVKLQPILHGGGHENGLRSGTLNVPGIVGLAKALELSNKEMESNTYNIKNLRNKFENSLLATKMAKLNGNSQSRLYNVSNICFEIDPFLINRSLNNIAFSQGSACNSYSLKPSHVLKAMGMNDKDALASFRFSFGKNNTNEEINFALEKLHELLKPILN